MANTPAKSTKKSVAKSPDNLPAHLKDAVGSTEGQENTSADDIAIPRLSLVQALSPVRDKKDDAYIDGIEEGDIYNTITEQIYGTSAIVIPVMYRREYQVWESKRTSGSGFYGSFESREVAEKEMKTTEADRDLAGKLEVLEVPVFFALVVTDDTTEEVVISFPRTKAKIAKKWNSLIRMANMASFAKSYVLASVNDESDQGKYYNFSIKPETFVTAEQYASAQVLYEAVKAGTAKAAPEAATDANTGSGDPDGVTY